MPKTAGAWVRYYGGQNKYSDRGMKEDYNTIQIGGDGFIADKYYLGGTFSYTDGNGTLVNGSSDDKNYNFGIYGGWLGEKGQFVDVIVQCFRQELRLLSHMGHLCFYRSRLETSVPGKRFLCRAAGRVHAWSC